MTVSGETAVDGLPEVKVADDGGGTEVEHLIYRLLQHVVGNGAGAEGSDVHTDRVSHADGVGELYLAAVRETGGHDVLGHPAGRVGRAAVDLGGVLAGEAAAAVRGASAIGVDNYLASGQTGVGRRAALDETAGRVDIILDVALVELGGDGGQNDVFNHVGAYLFEGNVGIMLSGDDNSVHADGTAFAVVLDGDLGLAVGTEVGEQTALAHLGEAAGHLLSEGDGQRHELGSVVAGVAEHHALVAGAVFEVVTGLTLLELERLVDAHGDVAGLLVNGGEYGAGVVVETVGGVVVAYLAHDFACDLRDVNVAAGGNLAHDVDHARGGGALAGDVAQGVLFEYGVQNGVGDLVADFVGMSFGDGLGSEEVVCHLRISLYEKY